MSTQSLPTHETLPVNGKISEKPPHRTSIFKEVDDLPRLWGRQSQPGYTGKRTLARSSDGGKEYSIDSAPGCYEDPAAVHIGRQSMPADFGYEMPERYAGKEVAYGDDSFVPLAGNNNSWVPPYEQQKRICGLGQKVFWIVFGIICLLLISGAVAAGVVVAASSRSTTRYFISNDLEMNCHQLIFTVTKLRAQASLACQHPSSPQLRQA
jgi:hypothetical protein